MNQSAYTVRNEDFISEIQVVCPKCRSKALVSGGQPYKNINEYELDVQFSCIACGYTVKYFNTPKFSLYTNSKGKEYKSRMMFLNGPYDPYFGFEVWYSIDTKFGLLWAYNSKHLDVIENYIGSTLRSRNGLEIQNNSIGSRLPQWVKDSKNREYLLKIIQRIKI